MRTVLTLGSFDMIHPGHIELLQACRDMPTDRHRTAPRVIVGLNKDSFIERFKGAPPIMTYTEREACLLALRMVDGVVPNLKDEDATACIDLVRPDVIAVGSDWEARDYLGQLGIDKPYLWRNRIEIKYIPRPSPPLISSTIIKQRVLAEYGSILRRAITE